MPLFKPSVYREIATHLAVWMSYVLVQVLTIDQFEHRYLDHLLTTLVQLPAQLQLLFTYRMLY